MNTQHLLYAVEVARFGSFSRAAESLEVGQPALSKAVGELEKSLGIEIFRRAARKVVPTEAGREFLLLAREALKQIQSMETLKNAGAGREALRVSVPPSAYILQAVADYASALAPGERADIRVREADAPEILRDLSEGASRLGILRLPPDREQSLLHAAAEKQLEIVPVWEFALQRTCSRTSPLLEGGNPADALEVTLFGDSPFKVSDRAAAYALLRANPRAFLLAAPMPGEALAREGLAQVRADGQRRRDVLLYPRGHKLTEAERKWVDKLYATKNKLAFTN